MNGRLYDPILGRFLSPDPYVPGADYTQAFNRFSYGLNNPLKFTDPNGEFPILAAIIFSAYVGGAESVSQGKNFWSGAWKGGLAGAVGGVLAPFGGGTFFANVAWGMGEGAITGGLNAVIWGNDIGKGMLYGAGIGGAFAAVSSGIEAYSNYKSGYGFRTNEGALNNYIKNGRYQDAINYVQDKYGMTQNYLGQQVSMKYNPDLGDSGLTNPLTGDIGIGPEAFKSSSFLKATMVHEYAHSIYDRILDANGNFVNWQYPKDSFSTSNITLRDDGPIGYANEIYNAGRLNIVPRDLKYLNPLFSEWNKGLRWLNILPQRYPSQVIIKWY